MMARRTAGRLGDGGGPGTRRGIFPRRRAAAAALGEAAASIYGLLKRTAEVGSREVLMVAAQDEFVSPSTRFLVENV